MNFPGPSPRHWLNLFQSLGNDMPWHCSWCSNGPKKEREILRPAPLKSLVTLSDRWLWPLIMHPTTFRLRRQHFNPKVLSLSLPTKEPFHLKITLGTVRTRQLSPCHSTTLIYHIPIPSKSTKYGEVLNKRLRTNFLFGWPTTAWEELHFRSMAWMLSLCPPNTCLQLLKSGNTCVSP